MRPHVISVPYRYDAVNEGLGLGPGRLLDMGLRDAAAVVETAVLSAEEREEERVAVNIGKLGRSTASLVAQARATGNAILVVAGDDTAAVGVVAGLQMAAGANARLGVIWIDAHGDFNTPDTSYSGILAGMPLAVMAGLAGPRWREAAGLAASVPGDRMLMMGTRDLDEGETQLIDANQVAMVAAFELTSGSSAADAVNQLASKCDLLLVNIDLDVLDPSLVPSSTTLSANGLDLDQLDELLSLVLDTGKVAAVSVTSLNPMKGARGQTSSDSAWHVIEHILATWTKVPALPAADNG